MFNVHYKITVYHHEMNNNHQLNTLIKNTKQKKNKKEEREINPEGGEIIEAQLIANRLVSLWK